MKFVGVDLHKHSITLCVVSIVRGKLVVHERRRFRCKDTTGIVAFFDTLERFQMTVESTIGYEWFVQLIEPIRGCRRIVVAHPSKMRVIAESTRKTDKIDAHILAEFLAHDMIPPAWMPTPRVREHRSLVRHRVNIQRRITTLKNRSRGMFSRYNADRADLFTRKGWSEAIASPLLASEKWILGEIRAELCALKKHLQVADERLIAFASTATVIERERREILSSMPGVGAVTIDVLLCELGDIERFENARQIVSYAGLDPGIRESDGKRKDLKISKAGSKLLRWAMIQLAWRVVRQSTYWRYRYENLKKRRGSRKAITAIARRQLVILAAMMRTGTPYRVGSHSSSQASSTKSKSQRKAA